MSEIILHDKRFKPYLTEETIAKAISEIAERINQDYKSKVPVFLVILNGAFIFASDLLRNITLDCEVSFIKLSSYEGTSSTGEVRQLIGINEDLKNKHLIILEDIVDTGTTLDYLINEFKSYGPADLKVASLLFKPDAYCGQHQIKYTGISIPNDFIVGYGLDYNNLGRNLKDIYVISEE